MRIRRRKMVSGDGYRQRPRQESMERMMRTTKKRATGRKIVVDAAARLERLVRRLEEFGELRTEWREAFLAVPRHVFIPEVVWRSDPEGGRCLVPLSRADDPVAWLKQAYARQAVVTQVDDGEPRDGRGRKVTSSASDPRVVGLMLAALDAQPGDRVLEIGTGTGYNAALLAHRLGAQHITTIEVDARIADHARAALRTAGFEAVSVLTGDGHRGCPGRAPFDRVISTAAAYQVPYAWIAQTRAGGRVLTPWANAYHDGLLSLTVCGQGTAIGGLVGEVAFMPLREQRPPPAYRPDEDEHDQAALTWTDLHPHHVAGIFDASMAISMRVLDCRTSHYPQGQGAGTLWLLDPTSQSWASLRYAPQSRPFAVRQAGPRHLWDEVETAYHWWEEHGKPAAARWRFTISPDEQRIELT